MPNTVQDIDYLRQKLADYSPKLDPRRHQSKRSAVTLSLRENDGEIEVLMMQRAIREGDAWSGQMAFPGGRMDAEDDHSFATALRECKEEVGIALADCSETLGRLSDFHTHTRVGASAMLVSAYVFYLQQSPHIVANHEVADTIWLPLSYIADDSNRTTMRWRHDQIDVTLPCYYYQEKHIWGLSLLMLDELVALATSS